MVYVHLAEGFEEIEALMVVDVLRRAEIEVQMVSLVEGLHVTGSHDICISADIMFEDADYDGCEMIVLPGGMPGTMHLNKHIGLKMQINTFHQQKKWLAAICAAPMIIGEMGLLKDEKAVCYPGWEKHLIGAEFKNEPTVVSGKFITGRGIGIADLFALEIVRNLKDTETAAQVGKKMLVRNLTTKESGDGL